MSRIRTSRPDGVRARTASSASVFDSQKGLSATMPGWIALMRTGASSPTSVLTSPSTPALTVVTVVDPGYGRNLASPPYTTIDAPSVSRSPSACTTSV